MRTKDDIETPWQQEQANHFNAAVGYYELQMLDEAEAELSKINPCVAAQSVPVLALLLAISYCRGDWNKMKAIARKLFLLDHQIQSGHFLMAMRLEKLIPSPTRTALDRALAIKPDEEAKSDSTTIRTQHAAICSQPV